MGVTRKTIAAVGLVAVIGGLAACGEEKKVTGITPQQMADALHEVMAADRTVYTQLVVNRLQNEEKVIKASEHWKDEKALPLPAQMFRYGAEKSAEKQKSFTYSLLSEWAINPQNVARTDAEKKGLRHILENKGQNYYTEETLGGQKYFTAVYADLAISPGCVTCHNQHQDSPRADFKLNDVMGGVVIRIAIAK